MHKIKSQTAPKMFQNKFSKPTHKYPTNFSTPNYRIPPFKLIKSKYRISIRGPTLWKNFPINSEKMQASVTVFKRSMRKKLPKVFFEKVVLKLIVLSGGILWSSVIFFNCYIHGQWSLSFLHSTAGLFFLASSVIFWATMFEIIFGRLHLEQHCRFRDLMIRP